MTSPEIIQQMVDYNYAYQQRLWDSIMTLTDAQFVEEIPYSHGSIRNHMVHLATADRGWMRGLQEDPDARKDAYKPEDYPTRESVRAICEAAAEAFTDYVASLDEAMLAYQPAGLPLKRWQAILHIVNHGTDHRAQVLRALHDFGAETFDQDMVYHYIKR